MFLEQSQTINALLFGLSDDLARDLTRPLTNLAVSVKSAFSGERQSSTGDADVIFCGPDVKTVLSLRDARPDASIVVVSRHPEVSDWLDSMEAGASDYCAAPFEIAQLKWILESSVRQTRVVPALA